jgi:hypothetical protein
MYASKREGEMRRLIVLAVVLVLFVVAIGGPASAADGSRSTTQEYEAPNGLQLGGTGDDDGWYWVVYGNPPFPTFRSQRGETAVSIEIEDEVGEVTAGHVHVDADRDGEVDWHASVCGKSDRPISIAPRAIVEVWILSGSCRDGTQSIATSGLVTATFHK